MHLCCFSRTVWRNRGPAKMLNSFTKHYLHCLLFFTIIIMFEVYSGGIKLGDSGFFVPNSDIDPWVTYGFLGTCILYLLRLVTFLPLPQVLFNFVGLTYYNAFQDKVVLKGNAMFRHRLIGISRSSVSPNFQYSVCVLFV